MSDSEDDEGIWWGHFNHVAPRVDEDRYQCLVPEWDPSPAPDEVGCDKSSSVLASDFYSSLIQAAGAQCSVVWDPSHDNPKRPKRLPKGTNHPGRAGVNEHLAMARALTEQTPYDWVKKGCEDPVPLESDEQALGHLTAYGGDVAMAQFGALALAGCGRGAGVLGQLSLLPQARAL